MPQEAHSFFFARPEGSYRQAHRYWRLGTAGAGTTSIEAKGSPRPTGLPLVLLVLVLLLLEAQRVPQTGPREAHRQAHGVSQASPGSSTRKPDTSKGSRTAGKPRWSHGKDHEVPPGYPDPKQCRYKFGDGDWRARPPAPPPAPGGGEKEAKEEKEREKGFC